MGKMFEMASCRACLVIFGVQQQIWVMSPIVRGMERGTNGSLSFLSSATETKLHSALVFLGGDRKGWAADSEVVQVGIPKTQADS